MSPEPIFHITSRGEYEAARAAGEYLPLGFQQDGFIHCSFRDQVVAVANTLFRDEDDLVLLEINPEKVDSLLRMEDLRNYGQSYPHIYGALAIDAITRVHDFRGNQDGEFELPTTLQLPLRIRLVMHLSP